MCCGKEGTAIRPEAWFLHIEDRIAVPDAVHGATYGAAAEVGEKCGLPAARRLATQRVLLQDYLVPYNAAPTEWPQELHSLFPAGDLIDSLPDTAQGWPSREQLAQCYGQAFCDLAFDDMLMSYPDVVWRLEHGRSEQELCSRVYPWFFPRAQRTECRQLDYAAFQDKTRSSGEQPILYPKEGGFGAVIDGLISSCPDDKLTVVSDIASLHIEVDREARCIRTIDVDGTSYAAARYVWTAPLPVLGSLFEIPFPVAHPQLFALGGFTFEKPVDDRFHELLVGSKKHLLNKINFPGLIAAKENNRVQLEYYFPKDSFSEDSSFWKESWLSSINALGIPGSGNTVIDFDFKIYPQGFCTVQDHEDITDFYVNELQCDDSNIIMPYPFVGAQNINRLVPRVYTSILRAVGCS